MRRVVKPAGSLTHRISPDRHICAMKRLAPTMILPPSGRIRLTLEPVLKLPPSCTLRFLRARHRRTIPCWCQRHNSCCAGKKSSGRGLAVLRHASTIPWNMDVPPDNKTVTDKCLQMSASHLVTLRKDVLWIPSVTPRVLLRRSAVESAGPFANETWLV